LDRTVPFRLGNYDCQQRLGGNYGEVYFAVDSRTQRNVLVKIMQPFGQPEMFRQRFLVEARVACQCVHERLIQTYEAGEIDGHYALVMEIPQGETLRALIDRGAYTAESEALLLAWQIAHAMAFLHSFGIVHRDLKPENIVVSPDGKMKLFDFGVARIADTKLQSDSTITPIYASPEQVRGEQPSRQSDVYSFGVVLFHLLTRDYPYRISGQEDLYNAIVHRPPVLDALRTRGLRNLQVVDLIESCLRKEPSQRPQSFDVIEGMLQNFAPAEEAHKTAAMLRAMALPPPVPGAGPKVFESMSMPVAAPPPKVVYAPIPGAKSRSLVRYSLIAVAFVLATSLGGWLLWSRLASASTRASSAAGPVLMAAMQKVPEGKAMVGKDRELTSIPAFEIDQTEVSNRDYITFCTATRRPKPQGIEDLDPLLPVVNVTFDEAKAFAKWAGKRLPTALEWERAARGDDGRKFPWGNEPLLERANVGNTGYLARVNARGDGASPFGVLNMVGNVWEWVEQPSRLAPEDFQRMQHLFNPPLDITEPAYQIRGGSYMHMTNPQTFEELVWDFAVVPGRTKRQDIGFRCAKD
jgi:formylglycine-generating enzyme required for sulfatase activity